MDKLHGMIKTWVFDFHTKDGMPRMISVSHESPARAAYWFLGNVLWSSIDQNWSISVFDEEKGLVDAVDFTFDELKSFASSS